MTDIIIPIAVNRRADAEEVSFIMKFIPGRDPCYACGQQRTLQEDELRHTVEGAKQYGEALADFLFACSPCSFVEAVRDRLLERYQQCEGDVRQRIANRGDHA